MPPKKPKYEKIIENVAKKNSLIPESMALTISPQQELQKSDEIVEEINHLTVLTRESLALKKETVQLEIDNKNLDTAKRVVDSLANMIDTTLDPSVLQRVTKNINTAQDLKYMTEAAEKLSNVLRNLVGKGGVDEFGNKKKQKINFMFKTSGASEVQAAVQIDNSD